MKFVSKHEIEEKSKKFILSLPYYKFIIILVVVVAVLTALNVYYTNLLATSGVRLTAVNEKIAILQKENQRIENTIDKLGSLVQIRHKAKVLGLSNNVKLQVLTGPPEVAAKQ